MKKIYVKNIKDCLTADKHKYNPIPNGFIKKRIKLRLTQRYSMPVYLRLTEYFYDKYKNGKGKIFKLIADYYKRKNEIRNQFEHGYEHDIYPGTLFHHTGVTIVNGTKIGKNVQIFKNVTFALTEGKLSEIGDNSIIFSHVIILGKKIGKNCVIGAGAVVNKDIPDNSIAAGVPAKIIGKCKDPSTFLEFK